MPTFAYDPERGWWDPPVPTVRQYLPIGVDERGVIQFVEVGRPKKARDPVAESVKARMSALREGRPL